VNAITSTPDGQSVLVLGQQILTQWKMLAGVSIAPTSRQLDSSDVYQHPKCYNFNEKANYFLANTKKTLLLSIEREDTRGGRDLYVSFRRKTASGLNR